MQTKLISQTGLKVRTNCRLGFYTFFPALTQAQSGNNKCIVERDLRSLDCAFKFWPKDLPYCTGNNNGNELDRCMLTVWELKDYWHYRELYKPE